MKTSPLPFRLIFTSACTLLTLGFSNQTIAQTEDTAESPKVTSAVAELHALKDGGKVSGKVTFTPGSGGLRIVAEVQGLTPGLHGIHIHDHGECTDPEGKSAGAHFNPTGMNHGAPGEEMHHAGDLGNITADASGAARLDIVSKDLSLDGDFTILNRAVIIHAKADDLKSQPAGESGGRIACGPIKAASK